ncbi:MAG: hypothetical protein M3501_12150, partial [Actinomycetota bacterium]|nr:hypothetical protein [Actinomycetota bacterium]
ALTNDEQASGAFNVCTGSPHTISDMAIALRPDGAPPPVVTGAYRLGDVRHVFASAARARDVLGFTASIGFDEGMRGFAAAPLRSVVGPRPRSLG